MARRISWEEILLIRLDLLLSVAFGIGMKGFVHHAASCAYWSRHTDDAMLERIASMSLVL
jgi:hypothetical protein